MSAQQTIQIAQTLLEGISSGRDLAEVAAPFASDLVFETRVTMAFCLGSAARQAEPL